MTKDYSWLPLDSREPYRAIEAIPKGSRTGNDEYVAFNQSAAQMRASKWSADIPLVVLTAGLDMELDLSSEDNRRVNEAWRALQADLVTRSPRGRQIVVSGSRHFIQCERPQIVIDSIRQVVEVSKP